MTKKKLNFCIEFSSIFHDPKRVVKIEIEGFSIKNEKKNLDFINGVKKLTNKYNQGDEQ